VTELRPVVTPPPVAGGLDVDLPGRDVRLRATRWPGQGTPVLLLHGLASTRHIWDLVVPGLAGLPVLALDQRGHGDSERPDGPYDGETVVADALTALDAVGLSRVVVVGHSWGAWTALRLAAAAPSRVLAVVCVDGGAVRVRDLAPSREQVREQLTPPRTALPPERLREHLRSGPLAPWWTPAVEQAVLSIFGVGPDGLARSRLPFDAHMAIVDDLIDADLEPRLPEVRCPAWLVSCSPDAARSEALQRAADRLPAPRVLRWDGALHDVPLQWPALVAGVVRAAAEEVSLRLAGEGALT
jgi:pimeloyl-ACP methyl ester carboxylesterase